jgi:hypothetical protein
MTKFVNSHLVTKLNQRVRDKQEKRKVMNCIQDIADLFDKGYDPKGGWKYRVPCFGWIVGHDKFINTYLTKSMEPDNDPDLLDMEE